MKKGKIKNALKIGLCSAGVILYLTGVTLTYSVSEPLLEYRNEKQEILKNYKISQEYQDLVMEKSAQYKQDYEDNKCSEKEYFEAVDYLFSDEEVEATIMENSWEGAQRLEQLNEDIKSQSLKTALCVAPMLTGAVLGAVGIVYVDLDKEKE